VVGIKMSDIDRDLLMMFALSYEYSMSFTNVLKLFKISKQYFWTFMEICGPMLKMGVRKASMLRRSVNKILPYLTGEGEKETLTAKEDCMLDLFKWFIEESFTDGEGCLTIEQLESLPFAQGYSKQGLCVAQTHKSLVNNLDRVEYVKIGDDKFYKTSKMGYYMEKFCGDLDMNQLNNLTIREMLRKIDEGQSELEQREKELC
jgi:hypothetical protein